MAEYGAAVTWVVIMFCIFVTGLLYMMLTPMIDMFIQIGATNGADPVVMQVIKDAIKTWCPIVIVLSLVVYGWRKSRSPGMG
jgi:hypothetical protein